MFLFFSLAFLLVSLYQAPIWYNRKRLGAESRATSLLIGPWSKETKIHKTIKKKISSVIYNQIFVRVYIYIYIYIYI